MAKAALTTWNTVRARGRQILLTAIPAAAILGGLYLISLHSYLLFHSLAELFSILIAWSVFIIYWNSRQFQQTGYLLFVSVAYLFVGGIDLLHTLAYEGMGVFAGYGANLATQYWIAARYMESLSLLLATFFLGRKVNVRVLFAVYGVLLAAVLLTTLVWPLFPVCYVDGVGLTSFKKISEYIICAILLATVGRLYQKRREFAGVVFRLLVAALVTTIAAELAFTLYVSVYGLSNFVGHIFKIVSFYLVYRVLIVVGITQPTDLMFHRLKQREEELVASEAQYRALFDHSQNGVALHQIVVDDAGRPIDYVFLEANDAFEALTGLKAEEIVGRRVTEVLEGIKDTPFIDVYGQVALTGEPVRFEQFSAPLNRFYDISAFSPAPGQFATVFDDITQRIQTEQALKEHSELLEERVAERTRELAEAQENLMRRRQLAMLGQMAGGVAHELRGPLGNISNLMYLVQMALQDHDDKAFQYLDMISKQLAKSDKIISDLLGVARLRAPKREPLAIPALIAETLADSSVPETVRVIQQIPDDVPFLFVDPQQIEQVLANLVTNACQAMPGGGELTIRAATSEGEVALSVADTGTGIAEGNQDKLFEPLFTTKSWGIGLGLAISRHLVEANGGTIRLERSSTGSGQNGRRSGTTFTVVLPAEEATL